MAIIEDYPDNETLRHAIQQSVKGDLQELNSEIQAARAGSGVLVSAGDGTLGYLIDKLLAGTGIDLTKKTVSGNETLTVSAAMAVVSTESALGSGSVNGEMRICADSGNRYNWDHTHLKWRMLSGNIYASAPPAGTYLVETGTLAVIGITAKIWNGSAWVDVAPQQLEVGDLVLRPTAYIGPRFLEADGAAVSRTTYADLFARYGTTFGPGDGSTTFNIIDMRGYAPRGWDHGAGVDPDAASRTDRGDGTGGDNVGTRQADELKSHSHVYYSHGVGAPDTQLAHGSDYGWVTGTGPHNTGATGGAETRMKNVNLMFCIYIG